MRQSVWVGRRRGSELGEKPVSVCVLFSYRGYCITSWVLRAFKREAELDPKSSYIPENVGLGETLMKNSLF